MRRTFSYDTPLWVTILGWIIGIIMGLGFVFGVLCFEGWIAMLLWNATLPVVFSGVTAISFWQSVGINLLIPLLFGGVGKMIGAFIKKD